MLFPTVGLQILVVLGAGVALGAASLIAPPIWVMAALLGTMVFVIALGRVEIFLLGLLIALSTIIPFEAIPAISIGPGRLFLSDLLLITPFAILAIRWLLDADFETIKSPLDLPVVLFFAIAFIASIVGLMRSASPTTSLTDFIQSPPVEVSRIIPIIRLLAYYLLIIVTVNLVRNEKQLSVLVHGIMILGTVNAVFMIVQFVFPSLPLLTAVGRVESLKTEGTVYQNVTRIINTTTEALALVAFITRTSVLLMRKSWKPSPIDWGQWAILLMALIITFKRSFWIGTVIAMVILLLVAQKSGRLRLLMAGLAGMVVFGIAIVTATLQPDWRYSQTILASADRGTSVFKAENYETGSSFGFRIIEANFAVERIKEYPLLGIGYGQYYRPWSPLLDWEGTNLRGYIHNGYLYVLTKSGLLGFLPLLWLSVIFVVRGLRNWKQVHDSLMGAVVIGFTLSYLVALIVAIVSPIFLESYWAPVIGLMMGVNEVIYRLYIPPPDRIQAANLTG